MPAVSFTASSININKMQGDLGFDARIKMKQDSVEFDNQVKFNPTNNMSKALSCRSIDVNKWQYAKDGGYCPNRWNNAKHDGYYSALIFKSITNK